MLETRELACFEARELLGHLKQLVHFKRKLILCLREVLLLFWERLLLSSRIYTYAILWKVSQIEMLKIWFHNVK